MSYNEACDDGVTIETDSTGWDFYYPPCHICGASVRSRTYIRGTQYTCKECRASLLEREMKKRDELSCCKKERKLQTAISRISKVADIGHYQAGIDYVLTHLSKPGWFQSTEEIMVALELIRQGVKANHQVKVFEYHVDFVLPDLMVVLEIDGRVFHGHDKKKRQAIRDDLICWKLGHGWQVIRIDTEDINRNITKLLPGIRAVMKYRQKKKEEKYV